MGKESLVSEFGRYTDWIVEAVTALDISDPIPAVCRGTGHPGLLEELAAAIRARPGMLVLDVGCGMAGPAAWLRREHGCDTLGIDIMEENARAARALFGPGAALVARAGALPFYDAIFDAVWAVGAVEMFDDKAGAFAEAARVLKPDGRVAVYTFTSCEENLEDPPHSNAFASSDDLASIITAAGLTVVDARSLPAAPLPTEWATTRAAVHAEVSARHGHEADFSAVREELDRFNRLRAAGQIEPWCYEAIKEPRDVSRRKVALSATNCRDKRG